MEISDDLDIKFCHFRVICRFCLQKNDHGYLSKIDFKENLNEVHPPNDIVDEDNILEMFEKCTRIKLSLNEKLPQNICEFCLKSIKHYYKFREMCIKSQESLENVLKLEIQKENKDLKEINETTVQSDNSIIEPEFEINSETTDTPTTKSIIKKPLKEEKRKFNKKINNSNKTKLKSHFNKKIKKIRTKKECPVCGAKVMHLSNHLVQHSDAKKYPCTQCEKVFYFPESLEKHLKKHNDNFYLEKCAGQCPICGKMYRRLKDHIERHENKIKCPQCKHTSWTSDALQKHINNKHRDKSINICDICKKNFSSKRALRDHYGADHLKKINYECEVCGKQFQKYERFRIHRLDHNEILPHKCDICFKAFKRKDHLNRHYRMHTGERPYPCPICGKGFRTSTHLRDHKVVHTKERPYTCNLCGNSYTQTSSLKTHKKKCSGNNNLSLDKVNG